MSTGVVVSGLGMSDVGRKLGRSGLSLTVEAALAAIQDAGLTRDDIDGVACWPGAAAPTPGFTGGGAFDLQDALALKLSWFSGGPESAGQLGAVMQAVAAIRAGLARHVICFRTVWESTAQTLKQRASVVGANGSRLEGWTSWLVPFGAMSAANWAGLTQRYHMHEYGLTREQLGALAVTQRGYAALNPKAVFRTPLTMDDYLGARMISDPVGLFDCDVPADGSTAVVVSAADAVPDLRHPPVHIEAMSSALHGRPYWTDYEDLGSMIASDVGRDLWTRTELTPADVDTAQLYDGFSILTVVWLEALGLCGRGEAGAFLEGGKRISLTGELPLNTWGGQLSAGRLHGFGHLHEACLQLRGQAGERQIPSSPEVAVAAAGGGPLAGALLLTR